MITVNDHQTEWLFDPWKYLGPKRRKLLEKSWSGVFRKYLLENLPVNRVARHFDEVMGRPSKELYTAIGSLILQQLHDLSDPDVTRALAFNLDWHYALDISDESDASKYISERMLRTYRKILIEEGLDRVLFETLTDTLIKAFGVDTSKQRLEMKSCEAAMKSCEAAMKSCEAAMKSCEAAMKSCEAAMKSCEAAMKSCEADSTLIQSNMRKLGRIRIFATTIRKFLKKLKRKRPDLFDTLVGSEFCDRYLSKESGGCFSQVKPSEASRTLDELAHDLLHIVELFSSYDTVSSLSEYKLLERVLSEQCRVTGSGTDTKVEIKPPKEVSPDSLQNPSDPDAGYDSHKGQGYQAQIMEAYQTEDQDKKKPDLITYVEVEPAHQHDANALQPAIDAVRERDCYPEELVCDTLYGGDDNVQEAAAKGVEIVAPLAGHAPSGDINLSNFTFDETTHFVTGCPEGHKPDKVCRTRTNRLQARFNKKICCACPHLKNCPVKPGKKASYLRYDDKTLRLNRRRVYEQTREFKDRYRWRAGIEGTNSHLKSYLGAGRLRVRGKAAVRFAVALKVLGLNIMRCVKALYAFLHPYFTQVYVPKNTPVTWINKLYALFHILLSKIRYKCEF
jgi:hypothetical protein